MIQVFQFHSFKQVLRGKARKLRQSGIGKPSNKDRSLTEEEKEVLWEADKFGSKLQKRLFLLCGDFWRSSLVTAAVKNTTQWKWEIFNSAKTIKAWSSCSLLKVQRRPDRADCRARREIFSHVYMFSVGGERFPVALFKQRAKTTKHAMVWSFLPQYQKKPRIEWQPLVQNSTNGRKRYY